MILISHLLAIGEKFLENKGWEEKMTLLRHLFTIREKADMAVDYTRVSRYLHSYLYSTQYILTLNHGWTQSAQIFSHTCRCPSRYRGWNLCQKGFASVGDLENINTLYQLLITFKSILSGGLLQPGDIPLYITASLCIEAFWLWVNDRCKRNQY